MDDYSALMKEVANNIGRKFDYGAYIQRSLEWRDGPVKKNCNDQAGDRKCEEGKSI